MTRNLRSYATRIFGTAFLLATISFTPVLAQTSNALNFDGAGDYAPVGGGNLITNTSYTKEAWIRISDASGSGANARNILSETNSSFFVWDNGELAAGQSPSYKARVRDTTPMVVGQWYHVAVTYDMSTGTMVLYKDGAVVAIDSAVPAVVAPTASTIGAIYWGGSYGYYFRGDMAELRVWNYARSAAEIALTANCRLPDGTEGLTAYYKFNEGIAGGDNTAITTLTDASGNGHDATLTGFALTGSSSNFNDDLTTVSGECSVVPVILSSFTARVSGSKVLLAWQTSQEINTRGFAIQRSRDGSTGWQEIGFVAGAGNSSLAQNYSFTDDQPVDGQAYYRLKQVDIDGRSTFSSIVPVSMASGNPVTLFPTVASTVLTVQLSDDGLLKRPYVIYDNTGRAVARGQLQAMKQSIDVSGLHSGVYILRITDTKPVRFVKR